MKKEIPENFIGYLDLQGQGNSKYDCFFSVNEYKVSIVPKDDDAKLYISTILNARTSSKTLNKWIFGEIPLGGKVAFYARELFADRLLPQEGTLHFYASIILKGDSDVDISTFEKIEFFGGIVNILYSPSKAEKSFGEPGSTGIRPSKDYTKEFNICIDNENIDVRFSITVITSSGRNRITDRSKSYSTLSFAFATPKTLDDLLKYYTYARTIFSFLTFTANVSFGTSIFTSVDRMYVTAERERTISRHVSIDTKINDGFVDYSNDTLDSWTKVIDIEKLTPNISRLFEVLYYEYLLFLPKQNKDQYIIYHHNVVDICSCLEREFKNLSNMLPATEQNILDDAKALHKDIKELINKKSCDDKVKDKALALISNLRKFQPSLKEKVMVVYTKFYNVMDFVANISVNFPDGSFESKIGVFNKLRNNTAHDGEIILGDNVSIYKHLILLVYISILHRAGYDDEAIKQILEIPFNYLRRSR